MTGLSLVGPPPSAPAPPARPAQGVRETSADFAGSLRSATADAPRPADDLRAEVQGAGAQDHAPAPEGAATEASGERTDEAAQDAGADESSEQAPSASDEETPEAQAAPAGDQREVVALAPGAPAAGPIAEENAEATPPPAGRAPSSSALGTKDAPPANESVESTRPAPARPGAEALQAQPDANAPRAQPGAGAEAPSDAPALAPGQGDASTQGDRDASRSAGQEAPEAPDAPELRGKSASIFEVRAGESSRPGGSEAVGRDAGAQAPALSESAAPATQRAQASALVGRSAADAGGGAEAADDGPAMQSVHRGLGAALRQRGGSVTIRLSPESLGQVRIEMSIRQGTVDVRFEASTEQARELLTRHAEMLRTTLQQRGFGVDRIDVHTQPAPASGSRPGADASADQHAGRRGGEHDAAGGESRGAFDQRGERHGGAWRDDDEPGSFEQWRVRVNATA